MRLETFSYLPPLTDDDLAALAARIVADGLTCAIEHTDDPDPRRHYWELWRLPLVGPDEPAAILAQIAECREAHPDHYVRVNGYDRFRQGQVVSFVAVRPAG